MSPAPAGSAGRVAAVALSVHRPWGWSLAATVSVLLLLAYVSSVLVLFRNGIGIFGNNIPVGWGFPIVNIAWWIDLGHGALLIAAGAILAGDRWPAISRVSESIALFAGVVGGTFAILHTGRPQYVYFLFTYPNTLDQWPQWRSPLMWDFFAIIAFLVVALIVWSVGMLPDLAVLRDRAQGRGRQIFYGLLALGWRGNHRQWAAWTSARRLLAGLALPLAVVSTGVSALDFAGGISAGYHSTLTPVDAIAAALATAAGMALTVAVIFRSTFALRDLIPIAELETLARVLLGSAMAVGFFALYEGYMAWYGANPFDRYRLSQSLTGAFAPWYWSWIALMVALPLLLVWRRLRSLPWLLATLGLLVNIGAWLDHYLVTITTQERGFMTSAWRSFSATTWDWLLLAGSVGLFACLIILQARLLPVLAVYALPVREQGRAAHG
ncbi:MAG: hydrogenase [Chromatiaceae bacterium]